MPNGTVTVFDENGFGFISSDSDGGEIWVRSRPPLGDESKLSLAQGDRVAFELGYGNMGVEAINVRRLEVAPRG
jgi:cold shock CspA family protein